MLTESLPEILRPNHQACADYGKPSSVPSRNKGLVTLPWRLNTPGPAHWPRNAAVSGDMPTSGYLRDQENLCLIIAQWELFIDSAYPFVLFTCRSPDRMAPPTRDGAPLTCQWHHPLWISKYATELRIYYFYESIVLYNVINQHSWSNSGEKRIR